MKLTSWLENNRDMKLKSAFIVTIISFVGVSCSNLDSESIAYGHFESDERVISAELPGKLIELKVKEGMRVKGGDLIAISDTMQIHLNIQKVKATLGAVSLKTRSMGEEIEVLNQRKKYLENEIIRFEKLLADGAATPKQVSDLKSEVDVIDKQISAIRSNQNQANRAILSEIKPLEASLELLKDQLNNSKIISPVDGIILQVFTHEGEFAGPGKPIAKIGLIDEMELKVYLTGAQLSSIKLGDKANVRIATSIESILTGEVFWISEEAEFTPKNIQTADEKSNLVYAAKIRVKNDGTLKNGMPGEIILGKTTVE